MKKNIEPLKGRPDYSEDEALSQFFNSKASSNLVELDVDAVDDIHIVEESDLIKLGETFDSSEYENLGQYPALRKDGLYVINLENYSVDALNQLQKSLAMASFSELNCKSFYLSVPELKLYINDIQLLPVLYTYVFDIMSYWSAPRVFLNKKITHAYVSKINNESLQKYASISSYPWGCSVICTTEASAIKFKRWLKDLGYQEGNNYFIFKKNDLIEIVLTDEVDVESIKNYSKSRDLIFVTI